MEMRIAIARVGHEANTFNPNKATMDNFRRSGFFVGQEILDLYYSDELGGCITGFISVLKEAGFEIIPHISLGIAFASGELTHETLLEIEERMVNSFKKTLPIDGVLLNMHGAMVSEEVEDVEGYLIEKIRKVVGPEVPIIVTFDLHAFITERKIENATAIVGYHAYPHTDVIQTGERAAKLLLKILDEEIKPELGFVKLPMIAPPEKTNTVEGIFKEKIFTLVHASEKDKSIVSSSLFTAQPWMDIRELGWFVVIYGYDKKVAEEWAKRIARECWIRKKEFVTKRTPVAEAIRQAASHKGKPVVISDTADSSGAGGGSTILLREMLRQKIECEALITIVDPDAAKKCADAGVGNDVRLKLGGKIDTIFSKPLEVEGKVRTLFDGQCASDGLGGGERNNGLTAVLQIGEIKVVITEYVTNNAHPITYRCVGLEPKNAQIVVTKSPLNFRAHYSPFASKIIIPEADGLATPDFKKLPYKNIPRPFYPFDTEEEKFNELRKKLQITN
jgi:microcystin degradation protein MlrC